jgi:hypothetical protein
MTPLWSAILLILAGGFFFVLLPVGLMAFYSYGGRESVTCPETKGAAQVGLDGGCAARSSIFGRLKLRVRSCSLWPERRACGQDCLRSLAAQDRFAA